MKRLVNSEGVTLRRLADCAAQITYEELADLTVIRARELVLDYIGTVLGGYRTELGKRIADFAALKRPGSDASILGDGRRSSLEGAAWANASISCIPGMTETHRLCGHAASELVPVVLALGEHLHLSGRRVIVALPAGYEVFGAIQPVVKVPQRKRGLDHKGQVGTLASSIVAGVAMGIERSKLGHALALAADMACGTEQYAFDAGLCDTEGLLAGYGAANGIAAASMADFGFRGPPGALDGPYGYYRRPGVGTICYAGGRSTANSAAPYSWPGIRLVGCGCVGVRGELPDLPWIHESLGCSRRSAWTSESAVLPEWRSGGNDGPQV